LTISNITDETDRIYGATAFEQLPQSDLGAATLDSTSTIESPNETFEGCYSCEGDASTVAREFSETFSDVLKSTWRASVSLQTIYTMLAISVNDQAQNFFTVSMPIEVVQIQSTIAPIRYTGLIIVAIVVLINVFCILALTTLYLLHCHNSLIGNFWHVISQTIENSSLTSDILSYGNMKKDCKVATHVGENDFPVRLMKLPGSDLVMMTKIESIAGKPPPSTRGSGQYHTKVLWMKMKERVIKAVGMKTSKEQEPSNV
jgi:hypothetical protein